MKTMEPFTIGRVAALADVGVETVRFYERKGLIARPPRAEESYRHYPPDTIARIRFIKRAKELGFSLREIEELLALRVDPHTTCEDVRWRAETKITDIEGKIRSLLEIKGALVHLTETCAGHGNLPAGECPILGFLECSEGKR